MKRIVVLLLSLAVALNALAQKRAFTIEDFPEWDLNG